MIRLITAILLLLATQTSHSAQDCKDSAQKIAAAVKQANQQNQLTVLLNGRLVKPGLESQTEFETKEQNNYLGHIVIRNQKIETVFDHCAQSISVNSLVKNKYVKVTDLNGKYVIPGLQDMHVHNYGMNADIPNTAIFTKDGSPVKHLDFPGFEAMNYRMLYSGVTSHLDLSSYNMDTKAYRDYQQGILSGKIKKDKNYLPSSNIYMTGGLFYAEGSHHGDLTWLLGTEKETTIVLSKDQIVLEPDSSKRRLRLQELIGNHLKKYKPDVLKISYDHNPHRPGKPKIFGLTKDVLQDFISVAKSLKQDVKVVCHVGVWQDVVDCMDAGAAAVTHIPFSQSNDPAYKIPDGIFEKMKETNLTIIPTMSVYMEPALIKESLFDIQVNQKTCSPNETGCTCLYEICTKTVELGFVNGNTHFFDDKLLNEVAPKALLNHYLDFSFYAGNPWVQWGVEHNKMGYQMNTFKMLMDANVQVLLGTDTMWEGMFFGFSVHRELELMAIAGSDVTPPASAIENMSILATATSQIDKFLNHQRGLIKEGYYADFVVLKSSPIKDIKNTRHIDSVIVNGETVDREYLQKYKMGIY